MTANVIYLPGWNDRHSGDRATGSEEKKVRNELRRARIRIAQLEASLTQAMCDNLANFVRARDAERLLAERGD